MNDNILTREIVDQYFKAVSNPITTKEDLRIIKKYNKAVKNHLEEFEAYEMNSILDELSQLAVQDEKVKTIYSIVANSIISLGNKLQSSGNYSFGWYQVAMARGSSEKNVYEVQKEKATTSHLLLLRYYSRAKSLLICTDLKEDEFSIFVDDVEEVVSQKVEKHDESGNKYFEYTYMDVNPESEIRVDSTVDDLEMKDY